MHVSKARAEAPAADFDTRWLADHLARERREASILSEIREAIFGAQDGLTSVLAVVSTVGGATGQPFAVLVAGFAAMLAGIFSMSAGEYMSSKSQRESFEAQIVISIENRYKFPRDTSAKILTSGLLGDQYIALSAGGDSVNLRNGDTLKITYTVALA